ncbi:MAG TPA: M28 family peptidase [Solirubrobacteraceae bacterium]|nr:M28 family peptidase [Solirubrobacteraceae bacterium]
MSHPGSPPVSWRTTLEALAATERGSASEGERLAARWIAERLRELGCRVQVEEEPAHGGYWWPVALANVIAAAGGIAVRRRPRGPIRWLGFAAAGFAAAALWDDLGHGDRWFRRALLPHRTTWNVVAEMGEPEAEQTVALVAHHDAAHSGLVFHPALGRIGPKLFPRMHERADRTLPVLYLVWLGPVLTAVGAMLARRGLLGAGVKLSAGATLAMLDIARQPVVPGANDNLSAVGVVMAVAERLREKPLEGLRVLLISTGSEESFSEGMQGFGRRHFAEMDPARTEFICLECLGGANLIVLEGEGMLRMRDYPQHMRDGLAEAADATGVRVGRGLRTVAATDAIIALRAGYPVVTLASTEDTKLPLNYHWPSDRPEALHWDTIEAAIATCESFLRRRAAAASSQARGAPAGAAAARG